MESPLRRGMLAGRALRLPGLNGVLVMCCRCGWLSQKSSLCHGRLVGKCHADRTPLSVVDK